MSEPFLPPATGGPCCDRCGTPAPYPPAEWAFEVETGERVCPSCWMAGLVGWVHVADEPTIAEAKP